MSVPKWQSSAAPPTSRRPTKKFTFAPSHPSILIRSVDTRIHILSMASIPRLWRTTPLAPTRFLFARPPPLQITHLTRRTLVAAPKPGSGPLLQRRPDRALPSISRISKRWLFSAPLFVVALTASTLIIFNYQKSSSSVVNSTLYALRTNEAAREVLGEQIYFASRFPWIYGTIDQLHGHIDIRFRVKGTKGQGELRFRSERLRRMGFVSLVDFPRVSLRAGIGYALHMQWGLTRRAV